MSSDLVRWVEEQIEQTGLSDEAGLVILAALEGDRQLDDYLASGEALSVLGDDSPSTVDDAAGTFLTSIEVEGFRGIGPAARIDFNPKPGLTIIAGRNGSGKSSLTEAFELMLTGTTYRWEQKSKQWQTHWRNLHHGDPAQVRIQAVEAGRGTVTVTGFWASDATDVTQRTVTSQRHGERQQHGINHLGWERPLELFRPILSYDELGGILEGKPSQLYDAIASVLGVEQLTEGLKRITQRAKSWSTPGKELTTARKELRDDMLQSEDDRAVTAAELLSKTAPDVDALEELATGSATQAGSSAALRSLTTLRPPDMDAVAAATKQLRAAVAGLADAVGDISQRRMARVGLLERALEVHAKHGEMTCPVCREGTLDQAWAATSRELADQEQQEMRHVREAKQTFDLALNKARTLPTACPTQLDAAPVPELEETVARARTAWQRWSDTPAGDDAAAAQALCDHLDATVQEVSRSVEELVAESTAAMLRAEDAWRPLATELGGWCAQWRSWQKDKETADVLESARKWLKDNDLRLKNERLAPISEGAREAWSKLRQESNVELAELSLAGSGTSRKVVLESSVDGEPAGLGVLSQGEIHALALALFLPRATMAESPFRFVVLDDPVQAMDPAKVDGLVELLADLARERQVIVLSHDDRLPAAARRAEVNATILEISRGVGSAVEVRTNQDPVTRYLDDARALTKDAELPDDTMRRALPGLLRMAVESAARDRYFGDRLRAGDTLATAEHEWSEARTTTQRVSLAIHGEVRNDFKDTWARAPYRSNGLNNVGVAMHHGLKGSIHTDDALHDVRRLVDDIRTGQK